VFKVDWTQIRIPTPLLKEIREAIDNYPSKGYTNEHEFIRDAVREKIEEFQLKKNNPKEVSNR